MAFNDLVGTPFLYGGRDCDGIDCYGVVLEYYRRQGVTLNDPADHRYAGPLGENVSADTIAREYAATWTEVTDTYQQGDVLVLSGSGCKAGVHCGVYLQGDRLLHAVETCGVIISPIRHYQSNIIKAYRWPGN